MNSIFYVLKKNGYNILEFVILNYYWVLTIGGLFWLFTGGAWLDGTIIPLVILSLLFFTKGNIKTRSALDFLWFVCLFWGIVTWTYNDYPNKESLIFRCISEQISYMMMYWVVRKNRRITLAKIIQTSYLPLILTCIIGIYCFIYEPSWYSAKTKDFNTDFEEFEFKRLRSIFIDGYIIMYYCAIVVVYEVFLLARGDLINKNKYIISKGLKKINSLSPSSEYAHLFVIGICILTIFFGIQRSAIAAIFLCLFLAIYYAFRYGAIKNIKKLISVLIISLTFCVIFFVKMDGQQQMYYFSKIISVTEDSQTLASERMFHNKNKDYDMFGDGMGRHNLYADKYNPYTSLRDGEYNKLLTEQGYIGASLYSIFVLIALFKSWKNFKYLHIEFSMIVILLISMIGANPLSTFDKHPVIFWAVFGQIANFRRNEKN